MTTQPDRMPIPPDTLAIFPKAMNLVYERAADGSPVIGILFEQEDLGHYMLWLSEDAAAHLASNITGMLDNRETFDAEWQHNNPDR